MRRGSICERCASTRQLYKTATSRQVGHPVCIFSLRSGCQGEPIVSDKAFTGIIGQSEAMRRVFRIMSKVSASHSTVLINGETGTGKGLAARAIHR
ncbi:MAG: sigma 54-interacting transcriptional regulator, partial [Desulfosarcina sp.]|nr:sigma 54-interacting transcriptional regulator [Desulfobacterales bacterium]